MHFQKISEFSFELTEVCASRISEVRQQVT